MTLDDNITMLVSNIWAVFLKKFNPLRVFFPCHNSGIGIVPALVLVHVTKLETYQSSPITHTLTTISQDIHHKTYIRTTNYIKFYKSRSSLNI